MDEVRIEYTHEEMSKELTVMGYELNTDDPNEVAMLAGMRGFQYDAKKDVFFEEREELDDAEMLEKLIEMGYDYPKMNDGACEMAINEGYSWDDKRKRWYE